jgi:hypothetical protein
MKTAWALGIGVVAGVILCKKWQPIARAGVKAGIRVGKEIKKLSNEVVEDIQDYAAEADAELAAAEGPVKT